MKRPLFGAEPLPDVTYGSTVVPLFPANSAVPSRPLNGVGHNSFSGTAASTSTAAMAAAAPTALDARREYFNAEIKHFLANRPQRPDDYMRAEEIGAAEDRAYLLLRALLDGVAYICRESIGTDARGSRAVLSVYVLDTVFSDNNEGCSTVSAPRAAALLGYNEKTVRLARSLLVQHGLLCRRAREKKGLDDGHWPVVNRAIAGQGTSTTWWLDATSTAVKRGWPAGKPRTAAIRGYSDSDGSPDPITPDSYGPELANNPGPKSNNPGPGGVGDLKRKNVDYHGVIDKKPSKLKSDEFTKEITKKGKDGTDAPVPFELKSDAAPSNERGGDAKRRDRGSRLPDNWTLPDEWRTAAGRLGLSDVQVEKQARNFGAYWTTLTTRNAVKRNWPRVWINWLENQIDRYGLKPANPQVSSRSLDDEVRELAGTDTGKKHIARHGHEEGIKRLREIVIENRRKRGL